MRILYISPEHTVGALALWKKGHESTGNECRYVTLFRSASGYPEDICLELPLISSGLIYDRIRRVAYKRHGELGVETVKEGYPPLWEPHNFLEDMFFKVRDKLWTGKINRAITGYELDNFDIYHLEWGAELFRDGRFMRRMKEAGKKIVCTYHGQDMRNRGVIPAIDELSDLNLTSELDLLHKHPDIHYLFLPFDTSQFTARIEPNERVVVSHATRNRAAKGSDRIIEVCRRLEKKGLIKFILVENKPHKEVLDVKSGSDFYIDQITDVGWGYGMNSVEALSMGVICLTKMNEEYRSFIPDHPFVAVDGETLEDEILGLIGDRELMRCKMRESREWVIKTHDLNSVMKVLYDYYRKLGWIGEKEVGGEDE